MLCLPGRCLVLREGTDVLSLGVGGLVATLAHYEVESLLVLVEGLLVTSGVTKHAKSARTEFGGLIGVVNMTFSVKHLYLTHVSIQSIASTCKKLVGLYA